MAPAFHTVFIPCAQMAMHILLSHINRKKAVQVTGLCGCGNVGRHINCEKSYCMDYNTGFKWIQLYKF